MSDQYLTVEQTAALLQLNPQTVRRLLVGGKLPGRKLSARAWRIDRNELAEFMRGDVFPKREVEQKRAKKATKKKAKPEKGE